MADFPPMPKPAHVPEASSARDPFWPAFVALVAGALAMGASPIFVRLADVGPFASAFWRVALALPVLFAWARYEAARTRRATSTAPLRWSVPAVLAGALFAGDLAFWHLAIANTTVANATFFATTAPVWVVLGSWAMRSEPIGRAVLLGLAMALGGGAMLLGESLTVAPERVMGDVFGLITAIFFGAYFLAVRRARRDIGAARITYVSSAVTAALLFVVAVASGDNLLPSSPHGIAVLLALALVSHAGGQGLLAYSLGHLPAAFSSLVIFVEAIAAAALAWIALGEDLSWLQIAGGAVILLGIWTARPRREPDRAIVAAAAPILPISESKGDNGEAALSSRTNLGQAVRRTVVED
jgi:drug/metabolite transporter (DMT)-like permease